MDYGGYDSYSTRTHQEGSKVVSASHGPAFDRVEDWVSEAVVDSSAFTSLVLAISRRSSPSDGYEVVSGWVSVVLRDADMQGEQNTGVGTRWHRRRTEGLD